MTNGNYIYIYFYCVDTYLNSEIYTDIPEMLRYIYIYNVLCMYT